MDWAKVPLEKISIFVAALIPGSSVLLVVALHRPDLWRGLWDLTYIGYQTKIAVLIFVAFVVGHTVNEMVDLMIRSVVSFKRGYEIAATATRTSVSGHTSPQEPEMSLWRKENWRKLLTAYLGSAAPDNVKLDDDPQHSNDGLWREWWYFLYDLVTPKSSDQHRSIALDVEVNFGSAGLIILSSSFGTPGLQHWWVILFCFFWVIATGVQLFQHYNDDWDLRSVHNRQMEYLQHRVCKGEQQDDNAR
jgi:hypothetical protein